MNIFMQVFGVCKSYNYITHLSTYTPTRSRANRRLVLTIFSETPNLWIQAATPAAAVEECPHQATVVSGFRKDPWRNADREEIPTLM